MNSILIKTVRINGFRGLKNVEVHLEPTTVLTGINNAGKTSFLKALQIVFGNRQFLSQDDFYIENNYVGTQITVDVLIVPLNDDKSKNFSEDWEVLLTTDRIKALEDGDFVPLRTLVSFDPIKNSPTVKQYILENWVDFKFGDEPKKYWYELENSKQNSFRFDEIPFFYMDAQRDILEDIKLKSSYIGKMLSKIEYTPEDILHIEAQLESLNQSAVEKSNILTIVKTALTELNSAMDSQSGGVEITPFTKKIRDLNKGLTINYGDGENSFLMDYHGMGTRSWSSLLTLKAFIELFRLNSEANNAVFFPIVAIEEPEAHLHPNAQKKLYGQINSIVGQKIISTHSPYIAAVAKIEEIRNFYKNQDVKIGSIDIDSFDAEDKRKLERQVINTRGEIFFSKCLVLFEGETEEQALPIFFEKHFGKSPVEFGVDFVGVGGYGNYLPFMRFAESLNIPWFVLSDNDQLGTVNTSVLKQLLSSKSLKQENDCIIFVNDNSDFEQQLISDGYQDEIKKSLLSLKKYTNEYHEAHQRPIDEAEINNLDDTALYEALTKEKAQFAPLVASNIVDSEKSLPPKAIELFQKISNIFGITESVE